MEKKIIQIQIAWFFSPYQAKFEDFSLKLKNKLGESIVTQQLPIPNDAPNEIPRLILSYKDFNLNVAKNRLDLFLKNKELAKTVVSNINDVILEQLSLSVKKIGFVKNYFATENIASLKGLLKKEGISELNLKEIVIRINEGRDIETYPCNNIESLSNGFVIEKTADGQETKTEGIIIGRDLNTLTEEAIDKQFNKQEIEKLIAAFEIESEKFILVN
jgi:hypothetical protein